MMLHFLKAAWDVELPLGRDWESVSEALEEDSGESGYFESFYPREDGSFRLFTKRRAPVVFNTHIPEIRGQADTKRVRLFIRMSKLSRAVEWITLIPAVFMCLFTAGAALATGIVWLKKGAAIIALLLVLWHMNRIFCFWWEVWPAVKRLRMICSQTP